MSLCRMCDHNVSNHLLDEKLEDVVRKIRSISCTVCKRKCVIIGEVQIVEQMFNYRGLSGSS